jgi:hypothetical protein
MPRIEALVETGFGEDLLKAEGAGPVAIFEECRLRAAPRGSFEAPLSAVLENVSRDSQDHRGKVPTTYS